uniref:OSJNBa0028M15.28 protein n=1 Tax=Oryza sativa subsp. japonica TaxID=39947 RepID=Q7FA42_ORYSJ|nr:OSJNBa0028M15.28 [Oryza sativa Japonica Group]
MAEKALCKFVTPPAGNMPVGTQACPFCGKPKEDASAHLQRFLESCSMYTIRRVRPQLLPFSLLGRAEQWFYINRATVNTRKYCSTAFLSKFFSIGKTNALRGRISSFQQTRDETIPKAWERLQELDNNEKDAKQGTVKALDSHTTCEVYCNTGHSGWIVRKPVRTSCSLTPTTGIVHKETKDGALLHGVDQERTKPKEVKVKSRRTDSLNTFMMNFLEQEETRNRWDKFACVDEPGSRLLTMQCLCALLESCLVMSHTKKHYEWREEHLRRRLPLRHQCRCTETVGTRPRMSPVGPKSCNMTPEDRFGRMLATTGGMSRKAALGILVLLQFKWSTSILLMHCSVSSRGDLGELIRRMDTLRTVGRE